ncbi:hypothetical protein AMJ82_04205 [candidate division TA06 bacterium SM23_40]|uniref:Thioredoxin-like fold domain-containing protein n=1 Tax=candidate division TA06 bacterium SM23_40 TaxID=1703774 RepID=A0A0S8GDY8_UNCT6|nr:MAG: hypothetical protein AMJ82_04205 [candidate division TA06 bacterium SM23_40]
MEIRVLGPGCPPCDMLMQRTMAVLSELGIRADIRHVTDIAAIADYGVVSTPALIIDGVVKSVGSVPSPDRIAGWLDEATREREEGEV